MGKKSLMKGRVGEREVAKINREAGYTESRRGQQYEGSSDSPDVVGIPGVHLEVKRVEKLQLWPSLKQAYEDAGDDELPVVVHRANRRPWIAILDYQEFLTLVQAAQLALHEGASDPTGEYLKEPVGRATNNVI